MVKLRLILLGIGLIVIAAIYLWGIRARIRERIAERRRRLQAMAPENEPSLDGSQPTGSGPDHDAAAETPATMAVDHRVAAAGQAADSSQSADGKARPEWIAGKVASVAPLTGSPTMASVEPVSDSKATPSGESAERAASVAAPQASARPPTGRSVRIPSSDGRRPAGKQELTVVMTVMAPVGQSFKGSAIQAVCDELKLRLSSNGVWECFGDNSSDRRPIFAVGQLREPGTFDPDQLPTLRTPGLLLFMKLPGPLRAVQAVDRLIAVAGQIARRLGGTVCDERRSRMNTQAMIRLRSEAAEFERQPDSVGS